MEERRVFRNLHNLHLVSSKLIESLLAGNYRTLFRGPGIEFDEVREYVEGDDIRQIDWNVTSRMSSPYTKIFREERELTLFLVVDVSASLGIGSEESKRDLAVYTAGLLAAAAVRNNDRVGGVLFSDRIEKWIPARKGRRHAARLVQDLLTNKPAGRGSDLPAAVRTVLESMKRRGICVIISDFRTPVIWKEMGLLARRHDVIALMMSDEIDDEFPARGLVELQDVESGELLVAPGYSRRFRSAYSNYSRELHEEWVGGFRRRGIEYLRLSTGEDPAPQLIEFFQRRRRH
ncbi:MAG TPA: DUF58 domain-containing protein [Spirochaetia bacterium]|nr:DUF58 domain-containing protein [Spirochaetia bacterium]